MAKLVRKRWGYNNNKAIQKKAYSGSEEDEVKAYKILG